MWYSTVTSTGPRSSSTAWVVIGVAQCNEGEKSTPAPVCNFQRHVSAIASNAPAAASSNAGDTPASVPTSPQTTLPRLMQPKNTVTNTANPRPRTQSGRASCAETLRTESDAIHDMPAIKLATTVTEDVRDNPNNTVATAVPIV